MLFFVAVVFSCFCGRHFSGGSCLSQVGEWEEAERLVTEMRGHGLTPDKYTYSSLMHAYGNSVRDERGKKKK